MKLKKMLGIALAVLVCLSALVGCGYNPEYVMTVDGYEVSAGIYLYFQYNAVQQAATTLDETAVSVDASVFEQEIEGIPAREWIDNKTMELVKRYVFIEKESERLGIEQDVMVSSYAQQEWENYSSILKKNGIGYDTFERIYASEAKAGQLITKLYGEDGEREIPVEDKQAYFEEHYTKLDYVSIPTTTEDGYFYADEDVEAILALADDMYAYAVETGSIEAAFNMYYQQILDIIDPPVEGMEDAAEEETPADTETDEDAEPEATLYEQTARIDNILNDTATSPEAGFTEAVFEAAVGDILLYKNEDESIVIIYQVKGLGEDDSYEDFASVILTAMAEEPLDALIVETIAGYSVEIDEKAKKYYSLDNIRFK